MTSRTKPKRRRPRRYCPSSLTHSAIRRLPRPRVEIDRGLAWFAVWTAARAEQRIQRRLENVGVPTYLPSEAVKIARRGRWVEIDRPVVSRYLFVGLNAAKPDFAAVHGCLEGFWPGIPVFGRVLRTQEGPLRVPASAVQRLADGLSLYDSRSPPWAVGGRFRAVGGAFAGFEGIVQGADDHRVRGLLDLFGRKTVVEFESGQLEAA
jgi:transcription antitermination factor NusG